VYHQLRNYVPPVKRLCCVGACKIILLLLLDKKQNFKNRYDKKLPFHNKVHAHLSIGCRRHDDQEEARICFVDAIDQLDLIKIIRIRIDMNNRGIVARRVPHSFGFTEDGHIPGCNNDFLMHHFSMIFQC